MILKLGVRAALGALLAMDATGAVAAPPPHPIFGRVARAFPRDRKTGALPRFKYSYTYGGKPYADTFVGTDPSQGAVTTTIPTLLIPVRLATADGTVTDPTRTLPGSTLSVIGTIVASPLFSPGVDFRAAGTDIGFTQYVDAFEKMALWTVGGRAAGYHVTLGQPKIGKTLKLTVPKTDGMVGTPIDGITVQEVSQPWLDEKILGDITKLRVASGTLPIFVTTQAYLLNGSCCIGGFHGVTSAGLPYVYATYIVNGGQSITFAQDVGALGHELAEWQDDPFVENPSPCGIYEVGDPLANEADYGLYPYALGGFVFHLQDLATPVYFGAAAANTLGGNDTFQGRVLGVCQNGS
jgi:hypothetical protein